MSEQIAYRIVVESDMADKSVGQLKQDFKDLNDQLSRTKIGTEEYKKTLQSLGVVKGGLTDLKNQIKALDPEKQFAAFAKIGSTVASGFAAAQAATALFGSESKDLMKVLVKVQAATALASGLQGLAGFGKALQTARLAMIAFAASNPFTLILLAVTAVGAAIYALTGNIEKESEAMKDATKVVNEYGDAHKNAQVKLQLLDLELQKEQGKLTEHEYVKQKLLINGSDAIRKINEKFAIDNAILTEKYNKGEFNNREEYLKAFNNLKAKALQAEQDIIKNAVAEQGLEYTKIDKKILTDREKLLEDLKPISLIGNLDEDAMFIIPEDGSSRIDGANQAIIEGMEDLSSQGSTIRKKTLKEVTDQAEEEKRIAQGLHDFRVGLASGGFNAIAQLATAFAGKSEAQQKKAFEINKSAGIAGATIDTYASAVAAYRSQLVIPSPDAPLRAAVAAGIAIASGLARVAVIAKTQFKSSAPSSDGAVSSPNFGGGSSVAPPTFQQGASTTINKDDQGNFKSFNNQQSPIKVYVLESDITNTQKTIAKIEQNAKY